MYDYDLDIDPGIDRPAETSAWLSVRADSTASLVENLLDLVMIQAQALNKTSGEPDDDWLRIAVQVANQLRQSLPTVRDALGHIHVVSDLLAEDLHQTDPEPRPANLYHFVDETVPIYDAAKDLHNSETVEPDPISLNRWIIAMGRKPGLSFKK